jgi:hypothetical protein
VTCTARTAICTDAPTAPFRIWPPNESVDLCCTCVEALRSMGLDVRDARPEWVRRAADHRLVAKEMTAAA